MFYFIAAVHRCAVNNPAIKLHGRGYYANLRLSRGVLLTYYLPTYLVSASKILQLQAAANRIFA